MAQMELLEDIYIKCEECGAEYRIDKDSLEYEADFIGERGMGAEFEHDFYGEEQCEECGNWMSYKVMGYEYPEGAYNSQDTEASGCGRSGVRYREIYVNELIRIDETA